MQGSRLLTARHQRVAVVATNTQGVDGAQVAMQSCAFIHHSNLGKDLCIKLHYNVRFICSFFWIETHLF